MSQHKLPIPSYEATKFLLHGLPTRRMRDVIEKRFGLRGGSAKTLQYIGREYKITRERVRQIEADALKHLSKMDELATLHPLFQTIQDYIEERGGVVAEQALLADLAEPKHQAHLKLLLDIGKMVTRRAESEHFYPRWTVNLEAAEKSEKILSSVVGSLEERKTPVVEQELQNLVIACANHEGREMKTAHELDAIIALSRSIKKNPYNEYGLAWWASVNPSGAKDKAYMAIVKAERPLHFRDVAAAINHAGWSKKKAHPQTVHNELIKDKRFVLVGRGLYALREWGYEPGAVRDVLVSVLKEARRPLSKEEIIQLTTRKRIVKVPTILLNLQNKSLFRRTDEGKIALV